MTFFLFFYFLLLFSVLFSCFLGCFSNVTLVNIFTWRNSNLFSILFFPFTRFFPFIENFCFPFPLFIPIENLAFTRSGAMKRQISRFLFFFLLISRHLFIFFLFNFSLSEFYEIHGNTVKRNIN